MKERGILFSAAMVKAILSGEKTQTRRIVKPTPPDGWTPETVGEYHPTKVGKGGEEYPGPAIYGAADEDWGLKCPYGRPGDRLWVRETWWAPCSCCPIPHDAPYMFYRANQIDPTWTAKGEPWRPSIHMPRWASRITLEVTEVRVQRLQDISEEDALDEGVTRSLLSKLGWAAPVSELEFNLYHARKTYRLLWDKINGEGSWKANPWVWVVKFKKLEEPRA